MKDIVTKLYESKSLEDEMKEWEDRLKEPFGQALKELQWTINDKGLYKAEKNEYGYYEFTPFDKYVTAYTLDGNKKYTYNQVKSVCDDWDWSQLSSINKILKKLEKLINDK